LEKEQFILVLTANNGDLFCVESHGSSSSFDDDFLPWLCQHPSASPSAVWPSPRWSLGPIQGNGDAELTPDDADNGDEAGGQTAAPNVALRPSKDGDSCRPTLQSSGRVRVVRTMENFDNYLRISLRKTAGLVLFGFATVLPKSGTDQPLSFGKTPSSASRLCVSLSHTHQLLYAPARL
jgi:hypothetical protein